jgi:hypothetical protein
LLEATKAFGEDAPARRLLAADLIDAAVPGRVEHWRGEPVQSKNSNGLKIKNV